MLNKAGYIRKINKRRVRNDVLYARRHRYRNLDTGQLVPSYNCEYKGLEYEITNQYHFKIDDYDNGVGSVEASHLEWTGFALLEALDKTAENLDFRFARPQDLISVWEDHNPKSISLYSANLRYIHLFFNEPASYDISLNTDLSDLFLSTRIFAKYNHNIVSNINFQGIESPEAKYILIKICSHYGINNVTFNNHDYVKDNSKDIERCFDNDYVNCDVFYDFNFKIRRYNGEPVTDGSKKTLKRLERARKKYGEI